MIAATQMFVSADQIYSAVQGPTGVGKERIAKWKNVGMVTLGGGQSVGRHVTFTIERWINESQAPM
jgi:hypothetical protein